MNKEDIALLFIGVLILLGGVSAVVFGYFAPPQFLLSSYGWGSSDTWILSILAFVILLGAGLIYESFAGKLHGQKAQLLPPPPPPDTGVPICPTCGQSLTYVKQYYRWYCDKCRRYP